MNSSTLATSCEELIHWKRLWCWEGLGAGEGDDRGWDRWMASPTRWTESEWTPGVGDGQGGLACCDSWGHKESDTTVWLIWSDLIWTYDWVNQLYNFTQHGILLIGNLCSSVPQGQMLGKTVIFFPLPQPNPMLPHQSSLFCIANSPVKIWI